MELDNRKKIVNKYLENPNQSYSVIAKSIKLPKSTVADVITRYKKTLTIERAPKTKTKSTPSNKKLTSKIKRSAIQNPSLSLRQRAVKYGTSHETVRRILKKSNLKIYRAIKMPNRNDVQNLTAKKRCRKLYDQVLTKFKGCLILDDETYVKVDQNQVPGQKFYVANRRLNVPDKYKFIKLDKFGKKVMIWQAICSCGKKSRAFVTSSTLNSNVYIEECLEKRLLPFIKEHNGAAIFWPDLASCHYSRKTMDWYSQNNIQVISKEMNPPNTPELRPIERYWAIVKRNFKRTRYSIKNEKSMLHAWNSCAAKVDQSVVRKMMASINKKALQFIRTGEVKN